MKIGGYATVASEHGLLEADSFTCNHCNRVVFYKASRPGIEIEQSGWCLRCTKSVCVNCADRGNCVPFEKKIERYEQRARLLAAVR